MREKIVYLSAVIAALAAAFVVLAEKWPSGKGDKRGNSGTVEKTRATDISNSEA